MKKIYLTILLSIVFFGVYNCISPKTVHADILSNLVGHWKFDEGSGTSAADSSGAGHTATLNNGATWVTGIIGPFAVNLNIFSNHYVSMATPSWSSVDYTMSMWLKSTANQGSYTGILYSRASTQQPGFGVSYGNNGSPVINQLGYNWSAGDEYMWNSGLVIPNGQWTFAVLVASSTGATIYMATSTVMNSAYNAKVETTVTFNGITAIGADTLSTGRYFYGSIDDVCVYTRAFTPQEVTDLYNSTTGCASSDSGSSPDYSSLFFNLF